ncbi:U2 snRNP complex subunit HSH155 TDEL_0G00700 [Torulaspora delbrueckii]|uniref:Phosphatase PP2A regulatory subunit A/Splicing factor 3B subunit 1-like HEAT repeat domain-containing protein n=1 Tax=Torulaspora delbrueckii TaxID=4950 RepID=G8ZYG2_TORDE|nr:hypothetical protein TDEL_0G00700 [Torulaspora delbrueckii]CCE93437.1 hypothetical protein TDEL_0G00700 [Torulaspora delbrueckii]
MMGLEMDYKRQLGGQYSISHDLKVSIREEASKNEQEDQLMQRMSKKSSYAKEDEYHKRRLDREITGNGPQDGKRPLEVNDSDSQVVVKRSRWDVQSYQIPEKTRQMNRDLEGTLMEFPGSNNVRFLKPSDQKHFALALQDKPIEDLTKEEQKERTLVSLLLRIKNGNTASRKRAMKGLQEKCNDFGPQLIFDRLLPILIDQTLEDQERHLMIKVIGRVLYMLGSSVGPYTHQILMVISPLLIDEDPIARETGREIITTLAHAAGLVGMLATMRPDIDSEDEYVRNTTSRAMAVVAKALGVPNLIPFLNAVSHSKKSWRARHTGLKIILQIGLLLKRDILPHLQGLMECVKDGLTDEHTPIRTIAANTIATLAQMSYPYGIESFNIVLEPLWRGMRTHRGKVLASFLRALGNLIPLMDAEYAGYYTEEIMRVVNREFDSPDDEMKKAVLMVLQKCCKTEGVTPKYLRQEVAPNFFKYFWVRRTALDRQLNKLVTYTTTILSEKVGAPFIIENLLTPLRDEAEPFRTMAVHAVSKVVALLGIADLDERLEIRLIDALLIAFQEQTNHDSGIFRGFGIVATALDKRMKPFLSPIISIILNHLKHKSPLVREHAADLCAILIPVIKNCGELEMLNKLSIILYESLGEVYPEVLGSILSAMSSAVMCSNLSKLQPPINQIVPTLTPILRNRHRKVEINIIELIGRIASLAPEYVAPKEWMRICFELLELLKSPNKATRRVANETFGSIARAIGPQDVLVALLNNLKVQERQLRVCSAIAIGIVAKSCGPYTALPAMMNEYKTPETNVQNGILKALAFMFEYIGDMSQDYIYLVAPLVEDALTDRDLVHRQTAANVIKHLALNCSGSGCEDAFIHFLNLLIPNIFETSPHVISRILEGLEALSFATGPSVASNYVWAGLFHPAKHVRVAFWRLYNSIYVQHADSLVPNYPAIGHEASSIPELDIVL